MGTKLSSIVSQVQKSTILLLAVILFIPVTTFAAGVKPDFTGKWAINDTKSTTGGNGFGPAKMLNITQQGNNLTVERTMTNRDGQDMTVTLKYTLDGKECDNSNERRSSKSTLSWSADGKSLTINTNSTMERDGQKMESTSVEIWKLGDDGKTLNIDQTMNSPRGERKSNLVYDKK